MKIYIAGPYTKGDVIINIRRAIDAAEEISKKGHTPFIPHLTAYWHLIYPHELEFWYNYDNEWLKSCDALYRIPGVSAGANMEVDLARKLGLIIYWKLEEIPDIS